MQLYERALGPKLFQRSDFFPSRIAFAGLAFGVHHTPPDENPSLGLILCSEKNEAVAHHALRNLRNKVLSSQYKLALPDEKELAEEIAKTRKALLQKKHRTSYRLTPGLTEITLTPDLLPFLTKLVHLPFLHDVFSFSARTLFLVNRFSR